VWEVGRGRCSLWHAPPIKLLLLLLLMWWLVWQCCL